MKSLSRILTVMLFCAPVCLVHAAPVATTSGSNLTAFNPSNSNNNQWATMTNGRYDTNNTSTPSAKTDLSNCNSLILRCAQPKCTNGGCAEISVATDIVEFCVKTNESCKQYHDDLVKYMPSQLVAMSTAKINEQNMALQQAKIQAEAAAAANNQSQEQLAAMQQQMQEMQYQMQQQQEQSNQQLQEALAQQQAQSQQALSDMKTAATEAAKQTEAGISSYQQEAIERGISADILERQKISGQVITEIENAEVSLKEVKAAMNSSFEYAGCDMRGNNCEGPKRVRKWRELAQGFIDPYNNTIDKIYEALTVAQGVGVDLSDIYMMLDDSCNSWGQYMCDKGANIHYISTESGTKSAPMSCDADAQALSYCYKKVDTEAGTVREATVSEITSCLRSAGCRPCTLLKILANKEEVYEGWVNTDLASEDNRTVVSCASSALNNSKFFASRARRKSGANLVDIDTLDIWINQTEPKYKSRNYDAKESLKYCSVALATDGVSELERAVSSKTINKSVDLCVEKLGTTKKGRLEEGECNYINPVYAICDTHPYNVNRESMTKDSSDPYNCTSYAKSVASTGKEYIVFAKLRTLGNYDTCEVKLCREKYKISTDTKGCEACPESGCNDALQRSEGLDAWKNSMTEYNEVKDVVRLKTTVLSQQMFRQYEYLSATLRRLKTQLEKAVVKANLEAAGAKSDSSSSGLLGGGSSDDKEIVLAGAENCWNASSPEAAYTCIQNNLNLIKSNASSNKKKAGDQLKKTVAVAQQWGIPDCSKFKMKDGKQTNECEKHACGSYSSTNDIMTCANTLSINVARKISEEKKENNRYSMWGMAN